MSRFYELDPSLENYWRAIILFGRNTASYKFALAKSLYDLYSTGKTLITLDELAAPYAMHLCERLKKHPKQITRDQSTFLDYLRSFNEGKISYDEMIKQTVRYGFNNVIDAFHNVHGQEVGARFFTDERKTSGGIKLTDEFFQLGEQFQFGNLQEETEARWRLVETAWENNISSTLMLIEYEDISENLIGVTSVRRNSVTSVRPALNGYQKGRCFYCFRDISVEPGSDDLADVDHFFPHMLKRCDSTKPIDGVANLVLACQECNRGENGKFERLPSVELLERLYNRNEYLITSHHPLRETLIAQTGISAAKRQDYLQTAYNCASLYVGIKQKWQPKAQGNPIF
jgi:5-methylcytosine-specific restriction endonuclease McrA